jgi:hypothetical protein
LTELQNFIVKAKSNGWVASESNGKKISPSRMNSLDITFKEGDYFYQDSFVGLSDFCGQEHICKKGQAIWSMAYFGKILEPDLIDGATVVGVLKKSLSELYRKNRFLGDFQFKVGKHEYHDTNSGDFKYFSGLEKILVDQKAVYELKYFGGLVRK